VSKKIEKLIKLRKPEKNNWKNRIVKKNRLEFWKNRPVWFFKLETEKAEPKLKKPEKKSSQTGKKPSQTEKNRAKLVFVLKKPNQNRSVWTGFDFKKKIYSIWLLFYIYKNQTEQKIITPIFRINLASVKYLLKIDEKILYLRLEILS
jgi:hypothetical protein